MYFYPVRAVNDQRFCLLVTTPRPVVAVPAFCTRPANAGTPTQGAQDTVQERFHNLPSTLRMKGCCPNSGTNIITKYFKYASNANKSCFLNFFIRSSPSIGDFSIFFSAPKTECLFRSISLERGRRRRFVISTLIASSSLSLCINYCRPPNPIDRLVD